MIEVEMTSVEIAELVGKQHYHVLRDIKGKLLPLLGESKVGGSNSVIYKENPKGCEFSVYESSYQSKQNKAQSMYVLNKNSVNCLVANYKLEHAMKIISHLHTLEQKIFKQEKEISLMKDIVWEVINGQAYISQEQALKSAGVKHPRLFIRYLKDNKSWYNDLVFERNLLTERQCNSHGDRWLKFTKDGFQWLLDNRVRINTWVNDQKAQRKALTQVPC